MFKIFKEGIEGAAVGIGVLVALIIIGIVMFYVDFSVYFEFIGGIALVFALVCLISGDDWQFKLIGAGICLAVFLVCTCIAAILGEWDLSSILQFIFGEADW